MTGIYLLFVVAVWCVIVKFLTRLIMKKIPMKWQSKPLYAVFFMVLLPLPLIDEIVGKQQFEFLCKENSTIQVNKTTSIGRTVYLMPNRDIELQGTWVSISLHPWIFVDATTGETVLSYNTLRAKRKLGIFEGHLPLTFQGYCAPNKMPYSVKTFAALGINYIEPPLNKKY